MRERTIQLHIKMVALLLAVVLVVVTAVCLLVICRHDYGTEVPVGRTDKGYLFVQTCNRCGRVQQRYYTALVTFIDDDGKAQALLHWERIIDATGIRMTSAIIPGRIPETTDYDYWAAYADWDLLDRLGDKGVEYVHHTYNHQRLSTFTEEQLHEDFKKSKELLNSHGINSDILVYPFYDYNEKVATVAAMYFDAAFAGHDTISTEENYDRYAIRRMKTNNSKLKKTISFPNGKTVECWGVKSASRLKKELKKAVEEDGWLVYVTHAYDSPSGKYYFDEQSEQDIIEFCHYAQAQSNVKIVTATEGFIASQPIG